MSIKLNNQKSMDQHQFLSFCKEHFKIAYSKKGSNFVWNLVEDDEIKGNETRVSFATRFKRSGFSEYAEFISQEKEIELWHYLYSVSYKERNENGKKSITSFFNRFLDGAAITSEVRNNIITDFATYPKFTSRYCAYSEKALKKLLPFLNLGENNFEGQFDLSAFHADLKQAGYTKSGINSFSGISEDRRQQLYFALWKLTMNKRIHEIIDKLQQIDFTSEKLNLAEVIDNNIQLPFPKGLFQAFKNHETPEDFTNLDLTKSSYLVYGRHSELASAKRWNSPDQIRDELHSELKQHSLNNPVAEKVILEMMQIVAEIWETYGEKEEGSDKYRKLFNKIHLEVGRELKKSASEKERDSKKQKDNRSQNKRLRQVLEDHFANSTYNAEPNNKDHFERLKIVEEGAEHTKNIDKEFFKNKSFSKKDIEDILKKPKLTKADFEKYKLWIEQGYRSPYTGRVIKLTDLFDGNKYNIDHVLPQASVTNNSLTNKVVCEKEVNKLKSNQTGRDFVNNPKEREVYCAAHNSIVSIVDDENYVSVVKNQFSGTKRFILLSKDIPKGFINSQLNNTRHISRKAMELLSHVVREDGEVEFRSKNVLPVTGRVTNELKKAWKLNETWTELVVPRYVRMNELTKSNLFGQYKTSKSGHSYFDCNMDELLREKDESYDIKRIDHRHHALDALIVALCTEEHVNYINNINSNNKSTDYGIQKRIEKYRETLKRKIMFSQPNMINTKEKNWYYMFPGEIRMVDFEKSGRDTIETKSYIFKNDFIFKNDYKAMILFALEHTIVTFKQNMRVINKTVNRYNRTPDKKKFETQNTKDGQQYNWAIRRSLGKDTFYGKKQIRREEKIVIRKELDSSFDRDKIETITDIGIQRILKNHLRKFDTIELPFIEGLGFYNSMIERIEFEAIVSNNDTDFATVQELIEYLKENGYKYKKMNFSHVNIFIENNYMCDSELSVDYRNDLRLNGKIKENPEIAFSPEMIKEMNTPQSLKGLNGGKSHLPIKKVRISRGFGKQRQLSENMDSVKSKQYVVTDEGSNLYLGIYEGFLKGTYENVERKRKFKDVALMELISTLKEDSTNRYNPLPEKLFDENQNEYKRIFTLSPLDLVYVPTDHEIDNPNTVDFNKLTRDQMDRIYKYVDGGQMSGGSGYYANFIPSSASKPIWQFHGLKNKAIYKELSERGKITIGERALIQNEFGLGSQQSKNQNMTDGKTQIKSICWKLKVDRLGNVIGVIKN